jgi:diguanylate cyclase (GGDEF)-like protein
MKIPSNSTVSRARPTTTVNRAKSTGTVSSSSDVGATGEVRNIQDTVSIGAIPPDEMTPRVQEAIMTLLAEVDNLRRELDATNRRLREMEDVADTDSMLPIPNRRAFIRELNRMVSFAQRYGTPSTLMFIDLNDMKFINDTYGHQAGDKALFHVAKSLVENVRSTDVVGRLGGDEFGVILAQADENIGMQKAETLAKLITEKPFKVEGDEINLNLAYGIYTFRAGDNPEEAINKADEAMYENKREIKGEDNVR